MIVPQDGKNALYLVFNHNKQEVDDEEEEDDEDDPNREFADVPTHAVQILLEEEEGECDDLEVGIFDALPKLAFYFEFPAKRSQAGNSVTNCATRMRVVGKMAACAFVPAASTVGHATDCVRTDLARSLWGRDAIQCCRQM